MKFEVKVQEHMVEKFPPEFDPKTRVPIRVLCAADPIQIRISIPQPNGEDGKSVKDKVVIVGCNGPKGIVDALISQIHLHGQDICEIALAELAESRKPKKAAKPAPVEPPDEPKPAPKAPKSPPKPKKAKPKNGGK